MTLIIIGVNSGNKKINIDMINYKTSNTLGVVQEIIVDKICQL